MSIVTVDTRHHLEGQRLGAALMVGISCAGFFEDIAMFMITLNVLVWAAIFIGKAAALHELDLMDATADRITRDDTPL